MWAELEELARPARDHRRLAPATRSAIILQLCGRAPLSVKELSQLLDRSEAYIGDAIRPLVAGGDLTFLYPDQPRHPRQKYISAAAAVPAPATPAAPAAPPVAPIAPAAPAAPAAPKAPKGPEGPEAPVAPLAPVPPAAPTFPNEWSNLVYVIVVGLLLALTAQQRWLPLAAIAAAALAWVHVTTNSNQFRRFRALQAARTRSAAFVVLKSIVTFFEIAVVYFAALAYNGRL